MPRSHLNEADLQIIRTIVRDEIANVQRGIAQRATHVAIPPGRITITSRADPTVVVARLDVILRSYLRGLDPPATDRAEPTGPPGE